jgi:hypothetical protein
MHDTMIDVWCWMIYSVLYYQPTLRATRYVSNTNQWAKCRSFDAVHSTCQISDLSETNLWASKCKKFGAGRHSACQFSAMFPILINGLQMLRIRSCAPLSLPVFRYVSNTNQRTSNVKIPALRASQPGRFQICFLYESAGVKMLEFRRCAPLSLSVFRYVSNTNQRASNAKISALRATQFVRFQIGF